MITKVPTDSKEFKRWADRECVSWPAKLQIVAWKAWASGDIREFERAYTEWLEQKQ